MNDLIRISDRNIGSATVQAVDARELHAFLEVGKRFASWINDRIEQYGFEQGIDYVILADGFSQNGEKPLGGRPTIEYAVTLDAAKELSMVERNDRGKQARQYFIEMERRAKAAAGPALAPQIDKVLGDSVALRGILLTYCEKVIALEAVVQEQAPKAKFHDAVVGAINCQSVQEAAKTLGTGPNRLFHFLRDESMLMSNNLPYQSHIDAGHFRVVTRQYNDTRGESHTYTRTLVTGKGLALIQKRMANHLPVPTAVTKSEGWAA